MRVSHISYFAITLVGLMSCSSTDPTIPTTPFLAGTAGNPQIGMIVNSTGRAVTMIQLGNPSQRREIALGASSAVTPVGMSYQGSIAAVPLGAAGSVAILDLAGERIDRFFVFPAGNATGAVFLDSHTVMASNLVDDYVGRFVIDQASAQIEDTVTVAPAPGVILTDGALAYVVSANLDQNFAPLGNGIVSVVDPVTMTVLDTIHTGGSNTQSGAIGPDGLLYVINTGDFVADGSVTVIDPVTRSALVTVGGFGPGPGSISVDGNGLAYVSGFFTGTLVWNTATRQFVRGVADPVCARVDLTDPQSVCRGAFAATADRDGSLYQVFFGDPAQGMGPAVFVYSAGTFVLIDSLDAGVGPSSIDIGIFTN